MNPKKTRNAFAVAPSSLPTSLALFWPLLSLPGCYGPRDKPLDLTQEEFELLWVDGGVSGLASSPDEAVWVGREMSGSVRPDRMATPDGPDVLAAHVFSENNENTRFRVEMYVSEHGLYPVLVGRGRLYDDWVSGSGVMGRTFHAESVPPEDAIAIASALSVPVQCRTHPGHKLEARFEPAKKEHGLGDKVTAVFQVKNVGETEVTFARGGDYRSNNRPDSFSFEIKRQGEVQEDIGPHHWFGGGIVRYVTLRPGESLTEQIDLTKWCSFSEAGEYEIACSTRLELSSPRYLERVKPDNLRLAHERWDESLEGTIRVVLRE